MSASIRINQKHTVGLLMISNNFELQDLSHFSLSDVPAEIFNFERTLESLNLESNNIRDLPRQLFHCQELRVLHLADNDLHVLPSAISSLVHLQGELSKMAPPVQFEWISFENDLAQGFVLGEPCTEWSS